MKFTSSLALFALSAWRCFASASALSCNHKRSLRERPIKRGMACLHIRIAKQTYSGVYEGEIAADRVRTYPLPCFERARIPRELLRPLRAGEEVLHRPEHAVGRRGGGQPRYRRGCHRSLPPLRRTLRLLCTRVRIRVIVITRFRIIIVVIVFARFIVRVPDYRRRPPLNRSPFLLRRWLGSCGTRERLAADLCDECRVLGA